MRITRWGEYGIIVSMYLGECHARGITSISTSQIAQANNIPLPYCQQILNRLRQGNVVSSTRGPKGGYALKHKTSETNLLDIMLAMEGESFEVICNTDPVDPNGRCHPGVNCGLKNVWTNLHSSIDEFLKKWTLQDLIEPELTHINKMAQAV